jgi:GAF domain-containing protein/ActR/RegA family two-component response regulator/anti-sigma regulatory factor (Ser/Thr protein kinase)
VAGVWAGGAALLLRQIDARHDALIDVIVERVASAVHEQQAALLREATLLAQDPAVVDGAHKGDWATLARGAARLRGLTLEHVADVVVVQDIGGTPLLQVPATPPLVLPAFGPPAKVKATFASLEGRTYLLAVAAIGGEPGGGVVIVGRHVERLDPHLGSGAGLVVVNGDALRYSTLPATPADGWAAATAAGTRDLSGEPWRFGNVGRLGGDVAFAAVRFTDAAAERRAAARALVAGGALTVLAAALVVALLTQRSRSDSTGGARTPATFGAALSASRPSAAPTASGSSRELQALYATALAVGSGTELESTATQTLDVLCTVARVDLGMVYRVDRASGRLVLVAHHGIPARYMEFSRMRDIERTPIGEVARTGEYTLVDLDPTRIRDATLRDAVATEGYRTQLTLPIPVQGVTWGVMTLVSRERRRFDADELMLLRAAAHQLGLAVGRAALIGELRLKSRRLEILTRVAARLAATVPQAELLQRVTDGAREMFDAAVARIWLVDDDGLTLSVRASAGADLAGGVERVPIGEGLVGRVVAARAPLAIADMAKDAQALDTEPSRTPGPAAFAGVPLLVGERVLGVLAIGLTERYEYSAEELEVFASLGNQAAVAIENGRLFESERMRREHVAALLEINTKIGTMISTEALLSSVAEEAARLLDVDNAGFRLRHGDELVVAGLAGTARETMKRARIKLNESISGQVFGSGRSLILDDITAFPDMIAEHMAADRALGYTTFLGVPLTLGGRTIGVLTFRARRRFTARDQELAEAFAGQAAVALEHARLVREASEQTERMRALADLSRVFAGTLDPDVVSRRIADCVRSLFASVSASLFRVDPANGDLVPVATSTGRTGNVPAAPVLPRGVGISGLAAESRRVVFSPDVFEDPHIEKTDALRAWVAAVGHYSAIAVPLIVNDVVVGVLTVSGERGRVFTDADARLAQTFADQAALALANARLYAESTQRRAEAEELARLARTLTESLDVSEVAQRTVDSVVPLFRAQGSIVRLLQPDGSLTALARGGRMPEQFAVGHVLPPGFGVAGRAIVEGRAVMTPDALADGTRMSDDQAEALNAAGVVAVLAVPMRAKGVIIGALGVADQRGRVFTDGEAALLQAFADQATLALENARLFSGERARRQHVAALAEIERELAAVLDAERLPALIVERATELFKASGALWTLEEDGTLIPRAWTGQELAGERLGPGEGLAGVAIRERRGVITNDYASSPHATRRFVAVGVRSLIMQPVILRDRPLGILTMSRAGADAAPFDVEDLALLQSLAAHSATALENARLYAEARHYAERLRALEEVNRLVSSSLEPDEVLANLARAISQFFDAPHVSVWSLDEATGRLRRALTHGYDGLAANLHQELAPGEGAVGWAVAHRTPILWTDVATDARMIDGPALVRAGFASFTAYPIMIGERVLGAFAVHRAASWPVTPETASLMGSLAAQAAVALENARLYSETTRRLTQTRALLEVAEILNSTLDARQLLKRLAVKVAQVCGVDRCSIERWEGDRVVPLMSQFADGRKMPAMWEQFLTVANRPLREVPVNARAIATRRPVIVDDASDASLTPADWVAAFGLKSYMTLPMVRQDEVIGVVTLDYCERARPFAPWQVDLATAVVGQIGLALENTRLFAEAQERLRETTTLLAVGRVLSQPDAGRDLMRRVAAEVAHAFGADMVGAYLLDERKERLVAVGGYHVPKDLLRFFSERPIVIERFPWLQDAWRAGRAAASADPHYDPRFDQSWQSALPPHSVLFVPTLAHGEPVGGLFLVWWQTGRLFEPAEIRLIEGVAAQVGLAMENSELARQTQLKLAETQTLLSVSRALSSTLDFQALLRHFLRAVAKTLGADCVGAWLVDADGEWMDPVAGYRIPPERLAAFREMRVSLLKHAFYAQAARTKRPVFTSDAPNDSRLPSFVRERGPHRTQLFVPVVIKDRMIAAFAAVWWETARSFSDDEIALMEAIANQAGVALENGRLFEENRQRLEELSVLHDLSRAVTGQLDRGAVVEAVRRHVARVLDARNMVVILCDPEREELEIVLRVTDGVDDPHEPRRYPIGDIGLMSVVLATSRPLRTDDYAGECMRHGVEPIAGSAHLRHWLGVPMTAGERVLGLIVLRGGQRPFGVADERLLLNIAHLAALALRSVRLFEERSRAYGELAAAQDQLVRTEKLRALGEMASGVAHDFNNLLASVLGRAQLLMRRVQDPQQLQWLRVIERSALDGAQTVRRLQEFTRIRRDQPMVPLDVTQIVRDALDITQSRWREEPVSRRIVLEVRTQLDPVPPILGDASELREALTNLILNAVDAMPSGGTLTLQTRATEDHVEVIIADTGVGIPADVRDKIFDPFFTTKGPKGTGLGLSMTYGIVSRHGGFVTVDSEEARGSTFRLSFPSAAMVEPPPAPAPRVATGAVRPLRCLVVDDEEPVRAMLADAVESAGHRATVVGSGAEAIERFRAEPFDVVLTDLAMPRVSGWQVARAVKQIAPRVPVFLVTGFGVELTPEERRAHGVDVVLVKPLQIQEILDALAEAARKAPPAPAEDNRWPFSI